MRRIIQMVTYIFIGMVLLAFYPLPLFAQHYPFTNIGVKDGLPQSSVFKIVQDPQGYIWMATEAGLSRYDGYEFVTYSIHEGLGSKFISDIEIAPDGRLWASTMGKGIAWFDGVQFHSFNHTNGFPSNQVRNILVTHGNELWVSCLDSGVIRVRENYKAEVLRLENGDIFNDTWKLIETANGDVWSAGRDGLVRFNKSNQFKPELVYTDQLVLSVYQAPNGHIWAGGLSLLLEITPQGTIDRTNMLTHEGVVWDLLYEEAHGQFHIGTNKGLLIVEDDKSEWLTSVNGLPYDHARTLFIDGYGDFWVGTYGGGATIMDSKGLDHFDRSEEGYALGTFSIAEDAGGKVWMSSENDGFFVYDGQKVTKVNDPALNENYQSIYIARSPVNGDLVSVSLDGEIIRIHEGKVAWKYDRKEGEDVTLLYVDFLPDGTYLLCSQDGMYTMREGDSRLTLVKDIPLAYYRSTFKDEYGYYWILGDGGELLRMKDGNIEDMMPEVNPEFSGLDHGMYDPFHKLWWFCSNAGLIVWNGHSRMVLHSGNGLHSDSPWAITQDSLGRIWIGHEKGVECIDPGKKKISFIGYDQGFIPVETNSCVAMTDRNRDVWFGTITSATRIRISDFTPDTRTSLLRVQKIWANKTPVYTELYGDTAPPALTLAYNKNNIQFDLVSLCYSNAKDVTYSWKLEGYDHDWQNPTSRREVFYSNLPPGKYIFRAHAIEPNGFYTNEVSVSITIMRPFWNQWWFYLTEILVFGIIIFFSFRFSSNPAQNKMGSFLTLLSILVLFESLLIFVSGYLNKFTGDVPVFQLIMNVVLAATLHPLEGAIRRFMKKLALRKPENTEEKHE